MLQGIQSLLLSESWNFCKHKSDELCWACNGNAGWQQELLVDRASNELEQSFTYSWMTLLKILEP